MKETTEQKMCFQIFVNLQKTSQYIHWKKYAYKWTHAAQIYVVQASTAVWKVARPCSRALGDLISYTDCGHHWLSTWHVPATDAGTSCFMPSFLISSFKMDYYPHCIAFKDVKADAQRLSGLLLVM